SGGGQRLRRVGYARPPHEQGAGVLRFVPNGAVERVDGGRPTSRGRPPAAFWGRGDGENGRWFPKRDSQGSGPLSGCGQSPPFSPRDVWGMKAVAGRVGSCPWRARKGRKRCRMAANRRGKAIEGTDRL